ncbi:MAG: hypothetical protein ACJA1C_000576 [Crocinitomicaceae bacterium]|jgi:hypothetical protein
MKPIKLILSCIAVVSSQLSFGQMEPVEWIQPAVQFIKTEKDKNLKSKESAYHFQFLGISNATGQTKISYSLDGGDQVTEALSDDATLKVTTTPGAHSFVFFTDSIWNTVTTAELAIEAHFISQYSITFSSRIVSRTDEIQMIKTCKPVIYLYPEKETEVEVKLDFEGEHPFLYPAYNDGWKCTASPNGDLKIGQSTYHYLFWEVNQPDHLSTADLNEGFIVKGENSISFLEAKLNAAGFTSKEKADFITFWGPLIQQNELNFVRFEFNEVCDKFAELNIAPTPDHIYRLYIFFSPIEEAFEVAEQQIPKLNREGFTVLEWGGQVSLPITMNPTNI